jgi:hypothetical protein
MTLEGKEELQKIRFSLFIYSFENEDSILKKNSDMKIILSEVYNSI